MHTCITTRFSKKFFSNIWSGTFGQTLYMPRSGSNRCVVFAVCVSSKGIRPHFGVTTTTGDSVLALLVISFPTQVVACLFCSSKAASGYKNLFMLASGALLNIETDAECWETLLGSMANIFLIHFSVYIVPSNTFTAKIWTILNQMQTCRSHICMARGATSWILITLFVAILNFGDSKRLVRHFHWGFKQSWLIMFGRAPVSARQGVGCRPIFVRPIAIQTLYIGFVRNWTSAVGISNCTSLSTVCD